MNKSPFILSFIASSGTGKTTLLTQLIPLLQQQGLKIGAIKHAHHEIDIDKPGKDSYQLREAGANPVILMSSQRYALMVETPGQIEADLEQGLAQLTAFHCDLILIEGFKQTNNIPKILIYRQAIPESLELLHNQQVIAIIGDSPITTSLPWFHIDDLIGIKDFILHLPGIK